MDAVVFQNKDDKEDLIKRKIVDNQKAIVILGSGINTKNVSEITYFNSSSMHQLKRQVGGKSESVIITLVARMIKSKGIYEFSEAAKEITKQYPSTLFLLVGSFNDRDIDSFSRKVFFDICSHVNWLGYRDDVANLIKISDIIVLPTYYREGIPRVLLEAAALGKPLIATDTPGCNEVIKDGENGFLVDPKNSIQLTNVLGCLISNPDLRYKMGEKSKEIINDFDVYKVSAQYIKLYINTLV